MLFSAVHAVNINEKMASFTAKASRGELKEQIDGGSGTQGLTPNTQYIRCGEETLH